MTHQDPTEFTDRERFILSYYRTPLFSSRHHAWLWDATIGLLSLVCVALFISHQDNAFGFVAYALVAGRLFYLLIAGRRWSQDYRSIFTKYDAKVKALTEALKQKGETHEP